MSKDVISWVNAALTRKDRVSLVMDWRRKLYHSEFDKINLALQLRQSDEKNNVQDIYCIDASDELSDGQVMSLFSFWMFHGRSQNLYGGSTWLNIRSISLSGSNLSHLIMELFFKGLQSGTPSLTSLDCSANQVGGYSNEDDFFIPVLSPGKELTSFIQTNKSLIHLRASYCNMGMNAINELALVLQKENRTLTNLDISANSLWWDEIHVDELDSDRCFNTTAMLSLANMMQDNYTLLNVLVSASKFQPHRICGRQLFTSSIDQMNDIEDDRDNLKRISFGIGGNMGQRASRSDLVIIMECLKKNSHVTSLSLSGLRIDHEAAEGLENLLLDLPINLKEINLTKIQTPMKTSELLANIVLLNLRKQWIIHDEEMEINRNKEQRKTGFVKTAPKGCDYDWYPPGEDFFEIQPLQILNVFSDVPIIRLAGGGLQNVIKLSLKGAGIGYHGAIVLSNLLQRNNTVTHLYLSENNIGTKGCMVLGDAIFGVSRSVVFVDLRSNGIENKAMEHIGKVLKARLERGSTGELGGNRPPPQVVTWDIQQNVIGGFGVSAELPGLNECLDAMSDMAERRALINLKLRRENKKNPNHQKKQVQGGETITVYLSGNQIRPPKAREMLDKHEGTRLKLYVEVRN